MRFQVNGTLRELTAEETLRLAELEEEAAADRRAWAASPEGRREAQLLYTALMTDTLLGEEER